jgi:hypothetical protein
MATGYRLDDWSSSTDGNKNFQFSMLSRPDLEPNQSPIQWELGALSLEVKWQWCEADLTPPTNAEVKNMWVYMNIHPLPHMPSWCST